MRRIASRVALLLLLSFSVEAQQATGAPLAKPDPAGRYLFYMHGLIVERLGPDARHPRYGNSDHAGIVQALESKGFHVIAEIRPSGTDAAQYARKVAAQVRALLAAGVPARNIAVTGFSKGGAITLTVAAILENAEIRFVVMAGCGIGPFAGNFERQVEVDGPRLRGRILSLYDVADQEGGSCQKAFAKAGPVLVASEKVLNAGSGHGLFFRPQPIWIDAVADWAMQ